MTGHHDCSVADCPKPAKKGGLCWGHLKAAQRGQTVSRELAKRHSTPLERLTEAALTYAEVDADEEWDRAKNNLAKSAVAYTRKHIAEATRAAMARLKAEGRQLGRPRKLQPVEAVRLVEELGGARKVAKAMGVSVRSVRRAVREARKVALNQATTSPARCVANPSQWASKE